MADGLFLEACRQVAKDFPHIQFEEILMDTACLHVSRQRNISSGDLRLSGRLNMGFWLCRLFPIQPNLLILSWLCQTCMVIFFPIYVLVLLVALVLLLQATLARMHPFLKQFMAQHLILQYVDQWLHIGVMILKHDIAIGTR